MTEDTSQDYIDTPIPHNVWTDIPDSPFEVHQSSGHTQFAAYVNEGEKSTLVLSGGHWSVRLKTVGLVRISGHEVPRG